MIRTSVIFFVLLIISCVYAEAQDNRTANFVVEVTVGQPYLLGQAAEMEPLHLNSPRKPPSLRAGLGFRYDRVVTGALHSRIGAHFSTGRVNVNEGVYELSYLNTGAFFGYGYHFSLSDWVKLVPSAHLGLDVLLKPDDQLKKFIDGTDSYPWIDSYEDRFRRIQPKVSAGLAVHFGPGQRFEAGVDYSRNLTHVYKDDFRGPLMYEWMRKSVLSGLNARFGVRL